MKGVSRLIRIRFLLIVAMSGCTGSSCFFDDDIPLVNDTPEFRGAGTIDAQLFYPESTICTLTVADLNDTVFSVTSLPCFPGSDSSGHCDSAGDSSWPGNCFFLPDGLGDQRVVVSWASTVMGLFRGTLLFTDPAGASAAVSYTVSRTFVDAFDGQVNARCWESYTPDDSTHLGFDYIDGKLAFSFNHSDSAAGGHRSAGMYSRFALPGDFYTTVDFKLRDEMDEQFEVGYFISTSQDTGRWSGSKSGIFISGSSGRLRFECRSIDLQSYSFETTATGGELGIRKTDSTVSYFFHDGNPAGVPQHLVSQRFPADTGVFVHLKMTVYDVLRDRICYWNDFSVSEGAINFPQ